MTAEAGEEATSETDEASTTACAGAEAAVLSEIPASLLLLVTESEAAAALAPSLTAGFSEESVTLTASIGDSSLETTSSLTSLLSVSEAAYKIK